MKTPLDIQEKLGRLSLMEGMTPQAHENRAKIAEIRMKLAIGALTYEEANKAAQPCIQRMNTRGAEIAKETGIKFRPLSFAFLMR